MKRVYEILGLCLVLGSLFFFVQCTRFLGEKDYLAGTVALLVGFSVSRVGVELGRLAVIAKRED